MEGIRNFEHQELSVRREVWDPLLCEFAHGRLTKRFSQEVKWRVFGNEIPHDLTSESNK